MKRIPHDELGRKRCSRCHEYKTLDCFSRSKPRADGYTDKCKSCSSIAKNPEELRFRQEQAERGLRRCAACKQWYPFDMFYFVKSVGRYSSYCKECSKAKAQDLRQKTNYNRQYYQRDTEGQRARAQQWRQNNPEKKLAQKQRRRARIHGNGGSFAAEEWQALKLEYDYRCLCCGLAEPQISLEPDHMVPISQGGPNIIENIQPLCHPCNARKSNKTIDFRSES